MNTHTLYQNHNHDLEYFIISKSFIMSLCYKFFQSPILAPGNTDVLLKLILVKQNFSMSLPYTLPGIPYLN